MGSVVVKKIQAEPEAAGGPLRWVASGKTILNNKGKPVKQYEPYFSPPEVGHRFEEPREEGVTPVIYYDAVGRTVRTEMPDGSFSRVEFSPWHVTSYDPNDTAFDPDPPSAVIGTSAEWIRHIHDLPSSITRKMCVPQSWPKHMRIRPPSPYSTVLGAR